MSAFLFRLGRSSARHPFRVLGIWLVVAVAVIAVAGQRGGEFNDTFRIPGAESQAATDLLTERFPAQSGATGRVVFHAAPSSPHALDRSAVESARAALARGQDVTGVTDPWAPGSGAVSADGRTAYVDVQYDVTLLTARHAHEATAALAGARGEGVRAEINGAIANAGDTAKGQEGLGILVAMVVLLVAFGSAVAMGIPIGTAVIGIVVGLAGMKIVASVTDVPTVSEMLGMMIGLGVGIDYALFVVTRHRQHLHDGMAVDDAAGTANATAGLAVLFAGATVVVAILGLKVAGMPAMTMIGLAIAVVVAIAMAAAVTLLPAFLGLAGTKIDRLSIHRRGRVSKPAHETLPGRWAHHVGRHPVRYAVASFGVLAAIALPVLSMRIGLADDSNARPGSTQRAAYSLLTNAFGRGFNAPIVAVVSLPSSSPSDRVAVDRVRDALLADPGIATVTPALFNGAGDTAVVTANPTTAPQDAATDRLVHHLRAEVIPAAVEGTGARAALTGHALETDVVDRFTQRLPWFIGAVVALSFFLLMTVFRSVLVPLKAALMNLLAIGAAYGVVVAVFQWGWGKALIGLEHTVPVNPFVPMIMFAILFGLSMDYEVFLLSRVREQFLRHGDSHLAVVEGLAGTARVITSAALIMISVFAAFVLGDSVIVKMIGVGLSVAVLLDATLVRLVLVPSTMSLLGSANWWLPGWLDRLLPHVDLDQEGGRGDGENDALRAPIPALEPAVIG
jgi:RND superfamily putative drug exporter